MGSRDEKDPALTNAQAAAIQAEMSRIHAGMINLNDKFSGLAVLEERVKNAYEAMGRAFGEIAALRADLRRMDEDGEKRLKELEARHRDLITGVDTRLRKMEKTENTTGTINTLVIGAFKWLLAALLGVVFSVLILNPYLERRVPQLPAAAPAKP